MSWQRRQFLGAAPAALAAISAPVRASTDTPAVTPGFAATPPIHPMRASADRIVDIRVCLRPFRAQGPRIEAERRYGKTIVHHYGHGGSGWSLSWGSARVALPMIEATKQRHIAIIGCGAIGLTTARVAQRAGLRVRIYSKDRPPEVASSGATGLWTPDSRLCTSEYATTEFVQRWQWMARSAFQTYQSLLGVEGQPVEWRDGYLLSDTPFDQGPHGYPNEPDYPDLSADVPELHPRSVTLAPGEHPFRVEHARRFTQMSFNIASYQRLLLEDFYREGGEIVQREFTSPRQWAGLPEHTIVNCTGYGARALLGDNTITPVRGQTARLVPQPEVDYIVLYRGHNVIAVPRRDGILVQSQGERDFGNEDASVDRSISETAVERLASLFA